ncbi:MAG: AAA family ATPase, partial [Chloroflexi bacterium]|nr:AAA family ATPase [Chloroflexota bacterium]
MTDPRAYELTPDQLRWQCDPNRFPFVCTDEIDPLVGFVGQDRALRALEFGLAMDRPGYGIFVTGLTGTGRASAIQNYLQRTIAERGDATVRRPQDWCYYYNFEDPDRPQLVALPRGGGRQLRDRCEQLLQQLRDAITRAFASPEFDLGRKGLLEAAQAHSQELFQQVERHALESGFILRMTQQGVQLIPHRNGKPLAEEEFLALPDEQKAQLQQREPALLEAVEAAAQATRSLQKEVTGRMRALVQHTGDAAIAPVFAEFADDYAAFPLLQGFQQGLRQYTLDHLDAFQQPTEEAPNVPPPAAAPPTARPQPEGDPFLPFRINVFVDNSAAQGPPVVVEPNPTYSNLFGKIERKAMMNGWVSDHTMLKPGALALANGGYLILSAREVLTNPGVWEGFKRALRTREIRLEDPWDAATPGVVVPQGMRPEPMPLSVKVIMSGPTPIYDALTKADEEFWEVFKVRADFDTQIDRTDEHLDAYARFVCSATGRNGLLPFHRTAVAQVAEFGARTVDDQNKLTSRFGLLDDVLVESDYWARRNGHTNVMGEDVEQALSERQYRVNLVEERLQEMITQGTIMVAVDGSVVGQVNGLAVYHGGDVAFGQPSRITVRTYMGRAGVINIEREAQMSGPTHNKGVLILNGYLGAQFAQNKPLSLSASIAFEQNYGGVDGDSASSTELYALLSSLSGAPLRQDLAVTGSVNQHGDVQAIGGVNEKIEGFYAVCKAKGLTGRQGVMIPQSNVRNLMLREDVVQACREGQFHVYAVAAISEGIEVLTGMPAGERDVSGGF